MGQSAITTWILKLKDELTSPVKKADVAVNKLTEDTKGLNDKIDDTSQVSQEATDNLKELIDAVRVGDLKSIRTGFTGIGKSIRGVAKASAAFIASPIGLTITALAGIAVATREWVRYNEAAKEANIITQQITRLSGEAVSEARIRAQALEKTFGKEYKENLTIAKNLVEAYEVSWDEAFNTIENGLIRGGAANDEYLHSLREYPRLFAQNGFSLKEFQRIVNTGIDKGIYDDKLPDAIKEFSLSINEQTESAKDALENTFGKRYTRDLFGKIKDGSYSARDALIDIAKKYEEVEVNAQQAGQLTADLFRGAGEDAGGLAVIMESVNEALIDAEKALTPLEEMLRRTAEADRELAKAQKEALESEDYIAFSNDMSLFWKEIKTEFYKGITYATGLFNQWTDFLVIKTSQVIGTVKMLPTIVKVAFRDILKEGWDVVSSFGMLADIFKKVFTLDFDGAIESTKEFKEKFKKEYSDLKGSVTGIPDMVVSLYDGIGKKVKESRDRSRKGAYEQSKLESDPLTDLFPPPKDPNDKKKTPSTDPIDPEGTSSGGKVINMTLNITNHFNVVGDRIRNNIEDIADQVIGRINDRLRDAVIALE